MRTICEISARSSTGLHLCVCHAFVVFAFFHVVLMFVSFVFVSLCSTRIRAINCLANIVLGLQPTGLLTCLIARRIPFVFCLFLQNGICCLGFICDLFFFVCVLILVLLLCMVSIQRWVVRKACPRCFPPPSPWSLPPNLHTQRTTNPACRCVCLCFVRFDCLLFLEYVVVILFLASCFASPVRSVLFCRRNSVLFSICGLFLFELSCLSPCACMSSGVVAHCFIVYLWFMFVQEMTALTSLLWNILRTGAVKVRAVVCFVACCISFVFVVCSSLFAHNGNTRTRTHTHSHTQEVPKQALQLLVKLTREGLLLR